MGRTRRLYMAANSDDLEIDNVEYAVLKAFSDLGRPLWKKRVHEYLEANKDYLPIEDDVSLQTVGRQIDTLVNNDYLDNVITSPDKLQRDLIIAFTPTDRGRDALAAKRRDLVKNSIRTTLFGDAHRADVPHEPPRQNGPGGVQRGPEHRTNACRVRYRPTSRHPRRAVRRTARRRAVG